MYSPDKNINPYTTISSGLIVDTNDPQGRGRIKVYCQAYGDLPDTPCENLPWCNYITPFGGMVNTINRGTEDSPTTEGTVAYGMWAIPKVGSEAVIMCLNGDSANRVYIGCLPPKYAEHTMPHGRYIKDSTGKYSTPMTSTEKPIQPLASNTQKAFGATASTNAPEYLTRSADVGVTGLNKQFIDNKVTQSKIADTSSGYKQSRINPDRKFNANGSNYDSQIYSFTTPGFHAWSMDDSVDNCRIRIRSACGHNVIIDDTNERIYINTAEGNNWIELDQDGSIDIYSSQSISINSDANINLNAKKSIRLHAENLYFNAENDIALTSKHVISNSSNVITSTATTNYYVKSQISNFRSTHQINSTSDKITSIAKSNHYIQGNVLNLKGVTALKAASKRTTINGSNNLILDAGALNTQSNKFSINNKTTLVIKSPTIILGGTRISATSGIIAPKALTGVAAAANVGAVGTTVADPTPVIVDGVIVDPTIEDIPGDTSGDSATDNLSDAQLAQVMDRIPSDAVDDTLTKMSSGDLGRALTEMTSDALSNLFNNISPSTLPSIVSNIPADQLPGILDKLPGAQAGNLLQNIDPTEINGLLSQLPTQQLGNILSKVPSDKIGGVFSNISDPNILKDVQSSQVGDILSNLPTTDLSKVMSKLDPSIVTNLSPALAGELVARSNTEKRTVSVDGVDIPVNTVTAENALKYPNFGKILATRPAAEVNDVISKVEPSAVGETKSFVPTNKLTGDSSSNQQIDISKLIPESHQDQFNATMTGADIGDKISKMDKSDVDSMMSQMPPDKAGKLLSSIPDTSNVLPNVVKFLPELSDKDKQTIMSAASSMDATKALSSLPNADVAKMAPAFSTLRGPDLSKVLANFNATEITKMVGEMSAKDAGAMLNTLSDNDFKNLIGTVPSNVLTDVFNRLDPEQLGNILTRMPDDVLNKFLLDMPGEAMTALLKKVPEKFTAQILTKMNGPRAAISSNAVFASYPLRIPKHEPWVRSDNKSDMDMTQMYTKNEPEIGRTHKTRNKYWRR